MSQVYSSAWSTCAARGESGEACRRKALDARVKQLSQNTAIIFCSLQSKFRIAEYSWCIFSPSIPSIYPLPDHSIPQLAKVDYKKWPLRKPGGRKVSLGVQPSIKWMCCFDTWTWLHRWGKRKCCVWWWRFCDLYESSELDKLNAIQWLPTWFLMFVAACLIAHGCDYFPPLISLLDYLWALTWQRPTFTLERTCFTLNCHIYIYISFKFHIYVTIYSIICTTSQAFHGMSPIITMAKERVKEQIKEQIALENLLESQGGVQVPRMPGIWDVSSG